jgi:hypothetical protein
VATEWAASFLPDVSRLIESSVEVRNLASLLLDDTPYRGQEDHVLAALVPEFRSLIDKFYAGKGPPLGRRFPTDFLAGIDAAVSAYLPRLVDLWAEVRRQVYAREGTTRDAVATFRTLVEQNRLFRFSP